MCRMTSLQSLQSAPSSGRPQYKYTPLEANQIRLLKLHPDEGTTQIQCSLQAVDLLAYDDIKAESTIEEWERFNTVSYTWGLDKNTVQIICNGQTAYVTQNLADALQRFRDPRNSLNLWVDALCINQEDRKERSAQVKLMGLIYFKAQRVRIWLGKDDEVETDHRAQIAVDLIKEYDALYESCFPDSTGRNLSVLSETLFKDPGAAQLTHWAALRRLMKRPWFTRVWVVQELGLSRNATFYCSDCQFDRNQLQHFERVMLHSKAGKTILRGIDMQVTDLGLDYWRSAWSNVRIELGEDPREAETFLDILRSTRGLQCTDPKDTIYAFLGHPSAFKRQRLDVDPYSWYPTNYYMNRSTIVSPNYAKSYKFPQLCIDLAVRALCDYDFGMEILSSIAHDDETIAMSFPSWVPLWDRMNVPYEFSGSKVYYDASKGFQNTTFSVQNKGILRKKLRLSLKAIHLGRVWFVMRSLTSKPPEYIANTMAQLLHDIPRRGDKSYITPPSSSAYPYDDAFLLALATSLSAGLTTDHNFRRQPVDQHQAYHLDIFKAWYRQQQAIETGAKPDPGDDEDADCFKDNFTIPCSHRVLFLTLEGRFGLGPGISDWKDEVWLPMGAKMPFVLRPTANGTYKIVGQTFLYGAMRGEAVQGKCEEDFEIVTLE